jgi:hypothetical protein
MRSHKKRLPMTAARISEQSTRRRGEESRNLKERSQYSCNYDERVKALEAFNFGGRLALKTAAPGCG